MRRRSCCNGVGWTRIKRITLLTSFALFFCAAVSTEFPQIDVQELKVVNEQRDFSNVRDLDACVKPTGCAGPMRPEELPEAQMAELRHGIMNATKSWGYYGPVSQWWKGFKNKTVLDVGMGQGPIGPVALEYVSRYTGLDPAICIDKSACTRNRKVGSTRGVHQCLQAQELPSCIGLGRQCLDFIKCEQVESRKYQYFPYTGLQMMQAYGSRLELLPGTFESLNGTKFLVRGSYDAVFMHTVTEHLPDLYGVLKSVFDLTNPGQVLVNTHHNFYGFGGHHAWPSTVNLLNRDSPLQRDYALWQHLTPGGPAALDQNLNRVRLGDLVALVDVYFECKFSVKVLPGVEALLTPMLLANLTRRLFSKTELIIETCHMDCKRRPAPRQPDRVRDRIFYHPDLDGSYEPLPLPRSVEQAVR